jgi:predicted transcriptional regulator
MFANRLHDCLQRWPPAQMLQLRYASVGRLFVQKAAIQAGIDDMEAGRVVAFEKVDPRLRAKLGLPPRA